MSWALSKLVLAAALFLIGWGVVVLPDATMAIIGRVLLVVLAIVAGVFLSAWSDGEGGRRL